MKLFSATQYSRSGGPGGQNVNKVNTKVLLTLKIDDLTCLNEEEKKLVRQKLKSRINIRDELFLQVQGSRSQLKNRNDAVQLLYSLIRQSLVRPRKRKKTKPSRSSVEKRLKEKKKAGEKKKLRNSRSWGD